MRLELGGQAAPIHRAAEKGSLLGNLASGIELWFRTLLTENVADIELTLLQVIGIVLPLGLRGLDESNIPTSGPTGTPSRDRRYGVFE